MKSLFRRLTGLLFLGLLPPWAHAGFTSLYVFGDGLTTTTNGPGGAYYYGNRYSNGRVWVEVLAQREGIVFDHSKNWSYFGHYSPNLVTNLDHFAAPADAGTALFVVWVNNADFVGDLANSKFAPYNAGNLTIWTNAIQQSLSNHVAAVQTLYAKGARTLVMPNAVDVTKVPYYVGLPAADKAFIRQRVIDFNAGLTQKLAQAETTHPGLTVRVPDAFALLDDLVAHPADYGLVNALDNGRSVDALSDFTLTDKSLTGPGASYIFWDYLDPTAKAHAILADITHQLVSPAGIQSLELLNNSNRLDVVNVPVGLDGFVEGTGDFLNWAPAASVPGTDANQTVYLPRVSPVQFYRLRFPHAWSWP